MLVTGWAAVPAAGSMPLPSITRTILAWQSTILGHPPPRRRHIARKPPEPFDEVLARCVVEVSHVYAATARILARDGVREYRAGVVYVPDNEHEGIVGGLREFCSCPHWCNLGTRCKHLKALLVKWGALVSQGREKGAP